MLHKFNYNEEPDGVNNDRDGTTVVNCIMFNTVHTPTMVIILCEAMAIMLSDEAMIHYDG